MKGKITLICILIISAVLGCSSDNSNDFDNQDFNKNLLKSVMIEKENYEEFYKYENGFLTERTDSWSDVEIQSYKYEYDAEGKVIKQKFKSATYSQSYSYEYDNQKRLVKSIADGSNDFTVLEYTPNKVIVKYYRETYLDKPMTTIIEFTTDESGRILKRVGTKGFTDENGKEHYPTTEFTYDLRGNIIKRVSSDITNSVDIVENEYDDKNNPYYNSYKKLNQSLYYLIHDTFSSFEEYDSPNNKTAIKYYGVSYIKDKILYNEQKFPVKKTRYIYEDGVNLSSESEIILKYY